MTEPTCARTHTHTRHPFALQTSAHERQRTLASWHNTSCRLWKSRAQPRQRAHKHKRCDVSLVHKRTATHTHRQTHTLPEMKACSLWVLGIQMDKFMLSSNPSFPPFDSHRWAKNNSTMTRILYRNAQMHLQLHSEHIYKHTHAATRDE